MREKERNRVLKGSEKMKVEETKKSLKNSPTEPFVGPKKSLKNSPAEPFVGPVLDDREKKKNGPRWTQLWNTGRVHKLENAISPITLKNPAHH
jgi:hypothetical protein